MSTERIAKLPVWAQEHITNLQRQRGNAVRALQEFEDQQTVSSFYVTEMIYDKTGGPTQRTHYIQTECIKIAGKGHEYEVALNDEHRLEIRSTTGTLVIEPGCSNSIEVYAIKP